MSAEIKAMHIKLVHDEQSPISKSASGFIAARVEDAIGVKDGYVAVEWSDEAGNIEHAEARCQSGARLEDGDRLLIARAENRPEWYVVGAYGPEESDRQGEDACPGSNIDEAVATVDGKRVRIEGADEIVLSCGKASITLRRNGRVVIRGAYVETRSKGENRIKGGSVKIN